MIHRTYGPDSPLSDFVEDVWLYDDYTPAHRRERIPPSAFPFFGLPASELVDTHVDLETLWGRSARELRDRLRAATTPRATFRVAEAALLAHLSDSATPHRAVRFALDLFRRSPAVNGRALCEQIGLSQRRFIEVFKAQVGLTPKLFHRVQRFHQLLGLVRHTLAGLESIGGRLRVLRPVSPHPRLRRLLRLQPGRVRSTSARARTTWDTPEAAPPHADGLTGQLFPIRAP
jgi:hypothetical protein